MAIKMNLGGSSGELSGMKILHILIGMEVTVVDMFVKLTQVSTENLAFRSINVPS